MKKTYKDLTDLFHTLHIRFSGSKLADETQHVLDSLFFAEEAENELEGAVAVCNALELSQLSPNYAWLVHGHDGLDETITAAEKKLDEYIHPHVKGGFLQLEDCYCSCCGEMTGMYAFGKERDKAINNHAVYEFMYLSNCCDGCWQNKYWTPEEG